MSKYDAIADGVDYQGLANELGLRGHAGLNNQMYSRCPFHGPDRSPSFSLNVENGLWYCHQEATGGTFLTLVSRMLGVSRIQARWWIMEHSVELPLMEEKHADEENPNAENYARYWASLPDAELPDWWFGERGFSWDIADRWGVRYDTETCQLIIPVRFPRGGEIVGLVRRNMVSGPKYINTEGMARNHILFGYDPQLRSDAILLTEGPLDVIAADRAGVDAVGLLGVSISPERVSLLQRLYVSRFVLALDNDSPGRKAANALGKILWDGGLDVRAFQFPLGRKDVGECSDIQIRSGVENAIHIELEEFDETE